MSPLIRLTPVHYGFGPTGKAVHVARHLRRLLGPGWRLELVARAPFAAIADEGLFDRVASEPSPERARLVVSIMDPAGARAARDRGEELWMVDSLAWFWDGPRAAARLADRYLYQDLPFLPVPQRNLAGLARTTAVPAIAPLAATASAGMGDVVLSLSGIESFEISASSKKLWWAELVLGAVEELSGTGICMAGNAHVLRQCAGPRARSLRCVTSQADFAGAIASARAVVAAPGLTTVIEVLRAGRPLRLLPPQNYSQLRIAHALRACTDIPALTWADPVCDWLARTAIPETVGSQIVLGVIAQEQLAGGRMSISAVRELLESTAPALPQTVVTELLGDTDGAAVVADAIAGAVL